MPIELEYSPKFQQRHIRFLYSTFCILCAANSSVSAILCVCVCVCVCVCEFVIHTTLVRYTGSCG